MKTTFLDFEQPVAELESKIEDLRFVQDDSAVDISEEIRRLRKKSDSITKEIYAKLSAWQISQVSRHPQRPYTMDYIDSLFSGFEEIHGDRLFADDPSAGWIVERPQVINNIWQSTVQEMQEGLIIQAIKSGEIPGSEIDTLLHFRKARETLRAGYVYALEKIMNGSSVETVFFDFMTTLNLFNLNPKEIENIVKEVLEDTKQKETI